MPCAKLASCRALRLLCLSASVFMFPGLGSTGARADGVMVERTPLGKAVKMVASPRQEALLVRDGDGIQVTLRTSFREGPKELAWVIPVPAKPEGIGEADDALFTKLEQATSPRFERLVARRGSFLGCSANVNAQPIGRVVVTETGRAGIFNYTVLAATGTTSLGQWLRENRYGVPEGTEPILAQYVRQGWWWLAIRLDAQRANGALLAPHPIRYTYRDRRLVYPLIISRLSADESNEVLLYILSNGSHGCENWANRIIESGQLTLDPGAPSGTNYEKLFQELSRQEGGHLFVPEFARDLDTQAYHDLLAELTGEDPLRGPERIRTCYLTRLRAIVPRDAMDRDVILVRKRLGQYDWIDPRHQIAGSRIDAGGADGTIVLGLLLVACSVFRRRKKRRDSLPSMCG